MSRESQKFFALLGLLATIAGTGAAAQIAAAPGIERPASPLLAGASGTVLIPTTIALQITSPLTIFYGESINGVAQVTAKDGTVATGKVIFYDDAKAFCTLALTNGANCTGSASAIFDAGTHIFTAVYSGDASHAAATSNAVTVTVKQDPTTTALASSINPVAAGGNVTYAAVVQGPHGPVAGDVEFMDGGLSMGRGTLDGAGRASLTALMTGPGIHEITTIYTGSLNSLGSTSAVVKEEVVVPFSTSSITIAANADTVTAGMSVILTAHVSAGAGKITGTVAFVDGGATLGSVALDASGAASWASTTLAVGQHSIVARYSGDANTAASVSNALLIVVNSAPPSDGGFGLGLKQVTINAGETAIVPVLFAAGSNASRTLITASCSGLPDEATCSYVARTLQILTAGPRDCGTSTPYGLAGMSPFAGVTLVGLFVPQRRRKIGRLLALLVAAMVMVTSTGCGTGNCTDLGSRPGNYAVSVNLSGISGTQRISVVVKP